MASSLGRLGTTLASIGSKADLRCFPKSGHSKDDKSKVAIFYGSGMTTGLEWWRRLSINRCLVSSLNARSADV
jgi:hypothetical protein